MYMRTRSYTCLYHYLCTVYTHVFTHVYSYFCHQIRFRSTAATGGWSRVFRRQPLLPVHTIHHIYRTACMPTQPVGRRPACRSHPAHQPSIILLRHSFDRRRHRRRRNCHRHRRHGYCSRAIVVGVIVQGLLFWGVIGVVSSLWGHCCGVIAVGSLLWGHCCGVIAVGSVLLGYYCLVYCLGHCCLGCCWVVVLLLLLLGCCCGSSLLGFL